MGQKGRTNAVENEKCWRTAADCAGMLNISQPGFLKEYVKILPEYGIRHASNQTLYNSRVLIDSIVDKAVKKAVAALKKSGGTSAGTSEEDEEIIAGANSPGLERYRIAKAAREEIFLKRDRGDYLPKEVVIRAYSVVSSRLRTLAAKIERMQALTGRDAADLYFEALDECDETIRRELGSSDTPIDAGDGVDVYEELPSDQAPDDEEVR